MASIVTHQDGPNRSAGSIEIAREGLIFVGIIETEIRKNQATSGRLPAKRGANHRLRLAKEFSGIKRIDAKITESAHGFFAQVQGTDDFPCSSAQNLTKRGSMTPWLQRNQDLLVEGII
jgi:hypothetical protein